MSSHATGNDEIRVNTDTTGYRGLSSVAALEGGGWIVTWRSETQDAGTNGIYQQQYDAAGNAVGDETRVNATMAGTQTRQSVTGLEDGGWLVTWTSMDQDGAAGGIYQQRYDADGETVGSETRVNSFTTSDQDSPDVVALDDGGWLVTWMSNQDGGGYGIYQQRYDDGGLADGSETRVNTFTTTDQFNSQVARLQDGGWLVTWTSYDQEGDSFGIFQQRYSNTGITMGGEVHVNTVTTNWQFGSVATGLLDGGWIVAWRSDDGGGDGIFQQRYDSTGAPVDDETQVNTFTTGSQNEGTVTALADGGWLVAWTSVAQDSGTHGVYQQRYGADGEAIGEETLVNIFTTGAQVMPSVSAFADGSWLVTWASSSHDGSDSTGIYQRYFAADVEGSDEAETLTGTLWDERVIGLAGTDRLLGGKGQDVLEGGLGADSFVFAKGDTGKTRGAADTIEDFRHGQHDEIDLSAIDANIRRGKNNAFDFIGDDGFSRAAGELRYEKRGEETYIYGDVNGDRKADFAIHLDGAMKLRAGDFDL